MIASQTMALEISPKKLTIPNLQKTQETWIYTRNTSPPPKKKKNNGKRLPSMDVSPLLSTWPASERSHCRAASTGLTDLKKTLGGVGVQKRVNMLLSNFYRDFIINHYKDPFYFIGIL